MARFIVFHNDITTFLRKSKTYFVFLGNSADGKSANLFVGQQEQKENTKPVAAA